MRSVSSAPSSSPPPGAELLVSVTLEVQLARRIEGYLNRLLTLAEYQAARDLLER
jgi:hypothetical protein